MKKIIAISLTAAMLICLFAPILVQAVITQTVSVPVTVSGVYNNVNYWGNATYSFITTDGVAEDHGYLSNGDYKFMYYPALGQIRKDFALEAGKGIPDVIVIPYTVNAFSINYPTATGGSTASYADKTITYYAANTDNGIFLNNSSANTKIVIPEGVTSIPSNVFGHNSSTNKNQEFILPSTLQTIGSNAFASYSSGGCYKEFIIPNSVTSIETGAFSMARFSSITIPVGVTSIAGSLLASNASLKQVTFKGNVTSIGGTAFRKCTALESITFEGKTAPTVSSTAFQEATAITPTVYYPANGSGYTDAAFTGMFPVGTKFEKLPGEPIASGLAITGKNVVGETLSAVYSFEDPLGRAESGSTVTWTSCENQDFVSSPVFTLKTVACSANTAMTYLIQETDDGKYIRCTVTPRVNDTELNVGIPVLTTFSNKVRLPQTIPLVTLTSPSNGYYVNAKSALTLSANATCDITTITKVEFYANSVKVAETTNEPFTATWTPTEIGTCTIYAKAYNAIGEDQVSGSVAINVLAEGANLDSYITTTFTSPIANSYNLKGTDIKFEGTSVETGGSAIVSIDIYANGIIIGNSTSGAFSFTHQFNPGVYSIKAVAKSADGKTGSSDTFAITVSGMKFGTMIANDMVLQRNRPIKLTGMGVDGTVVTAELLGSQASATVANGVWTVTLPAKPTTKSTNLKILTNEGITAEFSNVAIGEVIMCSGQSNMTSGMGNSYSEYRDKTYNDIRLYKQSLGVSSSSPAKDISSGYWQVATPDNAKTFSMVGYLTGRSFYDYTNGNIPVGLVWAAESGTSIQTWVPTGTYDYDPDLKKISAGTGSTDYNAMVAPWTGFTIGHVLWYQGESNSFNSQNYEKNLTAFIDAYRKAFNDEAMDFVIIQLPTYDAAAGYGDPLRSFNLVREGEYNVSKYLNNVATVISIDTGYTNTIHPGNKLPMSQRAARAIQHFADPNATIVWKSPSFDYMEKVGTNAVLHFKDIADGLITKDGANPRGFKLADNDGVFKDVAATLVNNTVVIDVSQITGDVKIRYAFEDAPALGGTVSTVNLINSATFPMAPFRTDSDRDHFKSYDSTLGVYTGALNFTPMIRYITAGKIRSGSAEITINARDYDDSIQKVEVFIDGVSAGYASQKSLDTWTFNWTNATEGSHNFYAVATDKEGTTSLKGSDTFTSPLTVSPMKYTFVLSTASAYEIGTFTDLEGNPISSFGSADGVKITSSVGVQLVIAAYSADNRLVAIKLSTVGETSIPTSELKNATVVKAFMLNDKNNIKPLGEPISIKYNLSTN